MRITKRDIDKMHIDAIVDSFGDEVMKRDIYAGVKDTVQYYDSMYSDRWFGRNVSVTKAIVDYTIEIMESRGYKKFHPNRKGPIWKKQ